jgi:hypothetical protein
VRPAAVSSAPGVGGCASGKKINGDLQSNLAQHCRISPQSSSPTAGPRTASTHSSPSSPPLLETPSNTCTPYEGTGARKSSQHEQARTALFLRMGEVTARIIVSYRTALMSCRFHVLVQSCPARRASWELSGPQGPATLSVANSCRQSVKYLAVRARQVVPSNAPNLIR